LPLPLAAVANRRDLIGIDNLADLLVRCVDHPAAGGATLPCSDDHPYSLAELVAHIRAASGLPRRLFALPPRWIEAAARGALGSEGARRLFGDFELDIRATRARLDWSPPLAMPATLGWLAGPAA
jgi:nucleoside-diphosphate-sugar epimerase